jgi:hypothetical protein
MYMETRRIDRADAHPLFPTTTTYEDPAEPDAPEDAIVMTTKRGLCRLAMLATEVGGRFQREGSQYDPMSWILAPRKLFGGVAALEACLGRDDFMRATLLHGLGLGMDAEPGAIDLLLDDEDDHDDRDDVPGDGHDAGASEAEEAYRTMDLPQPFAGLIAGPHLYTALLVFDDGETTLHAFHASVAFDASVVADRLAERYGKAIASRARIAIGMDTDDAEISDFVSPALARVLTMAERAPDSTFASGMDVNIEQRFDS